jgi:WD40 repeat protein/DNA-binding winged helix-turn-helix (wHTH) protein
MAKNPQVVYEFGRFRLDPQQRILLRDGQLVALAPKVLETLAMLVLHAGRIVEKEELLQSLWPESFVEEGNLTQNIFVLRKLLGDDRNGSAFIQTVPRRGYRFVAPVAVMEASATPPLQGANPMEYWGQHSPFRSLQAFEPEDNWLFFGRETETKDLLVRLDRSPVLALVGNSGSGKSSLVRAGLIPALHAGQFQHHGVPVRSWRIAVVRPSSAPFDYLAEALPRQLVPSASLKDQTDFIADCRAKLPAGGDSLRNAVTALANVAADGASPARVLLIADQFEEIFTLTSDSQVRQRYIDALLAAGGVGGPVPVHVVLVLRADFYANCLDHPSLSRSLAANLYNLPRMTADRLRESTEKRLALAGASAETGLIDSVLEDVGSEPGDLALLEHALGLLWEKSEGPHRVLSNRAYAEIGRLRGALGRHADAVYEHAGDEVQQRIVERIFLELVQLGEGAQDTRRRLPKSYFDSLRDPGNIAAVLAYLVSSRLISTGREGDQTFVEVSHEALIREWPALREWLNQNREELALQRRVQHAAEEWSDLDHDAGALLQGARLAQAEEWLAKHTDVPAIVRQFVQASIEARADAARREHETQERELAHQKAAADLARRSATRLRWFSIALAVLLLVAVGAAWFAFHLQVMEKSRTLAVQAAELAPHDQGRALDLALQSWRTAKTEESHLAIAKVFPQPLEIFKHEGAVVVAKFSPDGQRILTASYDHTARVWSADDGRLLATLQGHTDKVEYADFSPNGERIVTVSSDKTARVWNSADGHLLFTLQGHSSRVWRAAFSHDGLRIVTASDDHTARVWASADGSLLATLQGHTKTVGTANFSPDGQLIITTSWDGTARLWNNSNGSQMMTLQHEGEVIGAAFSPDSLRIVTASYDGTARVWDSAGGRLLLKLRHDGPVMDVMYSPDGQFIVTASKDHTARVWNSTDGRLLFTLQHDGAVEQASFSRDGRHIVTTSKGHARVWSSLSGRLLAMLVHADAVQDAAFSPDGHRIVTASNDHTARTWNTANGLLITTLRGHSGFVVHAEFAHDGQRIVTVSQDDTARLWRRADGRLLATLPGGPGGFTQAHFSPDDQRIVTAGADHTAQIWSGLDGRLVATLPGHTDWLWQAVFSPDGRRIVTASWDKTAKVWDATEDRLLATLQGHTDKVVHAAFSPDGRRIVTASFDHTARVWDSSDGHLLAILKGHTDRVWRASFSPDGRRIATASYDHTARVWDSSDGRPLAILQGHLDLVDAAEFSPDGNDIVTASWDHTARVWNTNGRLLAILQGHTGKLISAAFSADGRRIVTAGDDHTARIWSNTDYSFVAALNGHEGSIWQAAFSPDGQYLVTASLDNTARVWQVVTLDDIERMLAK